MSNDLNIRFQLNGLNHDVNLEAHDDAHEVNHVIVGGIGYSLQGDQEGIGFVKGILTQLPQNSIETLSQTGKELKARLWQEGAKDIHVSTPTHQIGISILREGEPLDVHQTINEICTSFEQSYVFPDVAKKSSDYLRQQLAEGTYDSITDIETFAQVVTADLRQITEDKHINLKVKLPEMQQEESKEISSSEVEMKQQYPQPILVNSYTYKAPTDIGWMGGTQDSFPYEMKAGYLEQNPKVGYLDLRIFGVCGGMSEKDLAIINDSKEPAFKNPLSDGDLAYIKELKGDIEQRRAAIKDSIKNLDKAESIVIDLRNNGGGHPTAVQLLCSSFMKEGLPLNTIEWRRGNEFVKEDFNTLSPEELPTEKRLLEPKVFILIGPNTFSAAEEFTNNMKIHERATIIGEPSGGGANPGGEHDIGENFTLFIPDGRAINPIQKGNWEGIGIIPDHVVPAEEAVDKAISLL